MHGSTVKHAAAALEPEDPFQSDPVHPAGRAGVPGPAAASPVRRVVVDVPRDRIGLGHVPLDLARRPRVVDGVEHVEELHRLVAAPEAREREDDPRRRVRVLASVLADPRDVALDVPRVEGRVIERRRQEQDDARAAPDQVGAHGAHRTLGALSRRRARENGPGLGDRVDLPLVVLGRTQRRAVVEVRAPVPLAVPGSAPAWFPGARARRGSAPLWAHHPAPRTTGQTLPGRRGGTSRPRRSPRDPRGRRGCSRRSSRSSR